MRKSKSTTSLNRRRVVLAGGALLGLTALPNETAAANDPGLAPAADLLAATRKLLSSLDGDQRKAAAFAWNGPEWNGWNYFGSVGGFIKPGLRLEQMNAAQKAAAWEVLATLFSPAGLAKTKNVMLLQDILAASGNGAGQRSSERFSFAFFGTPAETGAWGFRLEGHHLTQSIAVRDGRIVSVTPSSFSALPTPSPAAPMVASTRSRARRRWRAGSRAISLRSCRRGRACPTARWAISCPMRGASAPMRRRSVFPPPS